MRVCDVSRDWRKLRSVAIVRLRYAGFYAEIRCFADVQRPNPYTALPSGTDLTP